MSADRYVRVYYSILDDPKFADVYPDVVRLGTWLRLLMVADNAWPQPAPMPRNVDPDALAFLADVGLIDLLPGDLYRVHGMDAERMRRRAHTVRGGETRAATAVREQGRFTSVSTPASAGHTSVSRPASAGQPKQASRGPASKSKSKSKSKSNHAREPEGRGAPGRAASNVEPPRSLGEIIAAIDPTFRPPSRGDEFDDIPERAGRGAPEPTSGEPRGDLDQRRRDDPRVARRYVGSLGDAIDVRRVTAATSRGPRERDGLYAKPTQPTQTDLRAYESVSERVPLGLPETDSSETDSTTHLYMDESVSDKSVSTDPVDSPSVDVTEETGDDDDALDPAIQADLDATLGGPAA
jgi:hypothetical protein